MIGEIQEQRVDKNGVYIRLSNGKELTISTAEIKDEFNRAQGDVKTKQDTSAEFVKNTYLEYFDALGAGMFVEVDDKGNLIDVMHKTAEPDSSGGDKPDSAIDAVK